MFFTTKVKNVAPTVVCAGPRQVAEGERFSQTVRVTDAAGDAVTKARIAWGDGATSTMSCRADGRCTARHAYAGEPLHVCYK